jgi:flagellum-specific ATP synthase
VNEFVQTALGEEACAALSSSRRRRSSAAHALHGAFSRRAIAEYFRDRGQHVLLLMDSLTRFAQAQREIALAIGEPPATKGYPPRCSRACRSSSSAPATASSRGSITAFYTVLAEGDDHNDPIADAARAILDGHIVLSRDLAESGVYPPSTSRPRSAAASQRSPKRPSGARAPLPPALRGVPA